MKKGNRIALVVVIMASVFVGSRGRGAAGSEEPAPVPGRRQPQASAAEAGGTHETPVSAASCELPIENRFPGTEQRDFVIVIDTSGSVTDTVRIQKDAAIKFICGDNAPTCGDNALVPYDGSVAIAVLAFRDTMEIVVPLQLVDSAATAGAMRDAIECVSAGSHSTALLPTLVEAKRIFNEEAAGSERHLFLSTDTEFGYPTQCKTKCQEMRTMTPVPVQICTTLVGEPCPQANELLMDFANTVDAGTYDEQQPRGFYRCAETEDEFASLFSCCSPLLGILDCNDNNFADDCDIAECDGDPGCEDCQPNGIPDECEWAACCDPANDCTLVPEDCCTSEGAVWWAGHTCDEVPNCLHGACCDDTTGTCQYSSLQDCPGTFLGAGTSCEPSCCRQPENNGGDCACDTYQCATNGGTVFTGVDCTNNASVCDPGVETCELYCAGPLPHVLGMPFQCSDPVFGGPLSPEVPCTTDTQCDAEVPGSMCDLELYGVGETITFTGDSTTADVDLSVGDWCTLDAADPGWYEAFTLEECGLITIDHCCDVGQAGAKRPVWPMLRSDCPCDVNGGQPILPDVNANGWRSGFGWGCNAEAGCCDDGNWSGTFTLPAGTYSWQIAAGRVCAGTTIACNDDNDCGGGPCLDTRGPYIGHITVERCQVAVCCTGDTCSTTNKLDCTNLGGTWLGDRGHPIVACPPELPDNPCATGACCRADGSCADAQTPSSCSLVGGVYHAGSTCSPCTCVIGETACSDGVDEDCDGNADCLDPDCADDPYCQPVACCLPDAICGMIDPTTCGAQGGTIVVGGGSCLADNNANGIADVCELGTPILAGPPHDIPKNRYISIDALTPNPGLTSFDINVTLTATEVSDGPAVGTSWWAEAPDAACCSAVRPFRPAVAPDWAACPTIHLTGCLIIPTSTYDIVISDGTNRSEAMSTSTQARPSGNKWWCDTVGSFDGMQWSPPNGVVNYDDALAAIKSWQAMPGAPHLSVTDVHPQDPNRIVNFNDVLLIVLGFKGAEYPWGCPLSPCWNRDEGPCPSGASGDTPLMSSPKSSRSDLQVSRVGNLRVPKLMAVDTQVPSTPKVVTASTLSLVSSSEFNMPGDLVDIDVYVDAAADLGGYQLAIDVTGGTTGSVTLESMLVDDLRTDYAFYSVSNISAVSDVAGQIGAASMTGSGIELTAPAYLGTFQVRASADAGGVFHVTFRAIDENFLMDGAANALTDTITGDGIYIGVDVDCTVDAQCDDGNDCTDDTCDAGFCTNVNDDTNACTDGNDCTDDACNAGVCESVNDDTNACTDGNDCTADTCSAGACISTNEPVGTPCNDGLFCTETDTCDGAGTCVGTGNPCPRGEICSEPMDTCLPSLP